MSLIDIKTVDEQARKELAEERSKEAVKRLKELYAKRDAALRVVANIDREIEDTKQAIADGN